MALGTAQSILQWTGPVTRRQRVDRLSARRLAALREAVDALQRDGEYAELAAVHAKPAHLGTPLFLPWNRAYLRTFEARLQERAPGAAVPWWDWFGHRAIPEAFSQSGDEPNPLARIEVPSGRGERRGSFGSNDLPHEDGLRLLPRLESYEEFSRTVEAAHDQVHVWVGGTLGEAPLAAYDPLFWAIQATVDRMWRVWQLRHPEAVIPTELFEALLEPFGLRAADVLAPPSIGYDYTDLPRPPAQPGEPEAEPWRPALPGYRSDEVAAVPVDHLGIEPEVEALCWVIAARETSPPLSIGLFGDWGSGKTTFMALMRERIKELAEEGSARKEAPWCGRVEQIVFNAWTYADDNLWASLVTEILTAVAVPENYEAGADDENAEGVLGAIARRRRDAEQELEDADERIDVADTKLGQLPDSPEGLARDVLVGAGGGDAGAAMARDPMVKDVRDAVGATVGADAAAAVDDAVTAAAGFATLAARVRALGKFLRGDGSLRGRARLLVGLAVLLLAGAIAAISLTDNWQAIFAFVAAAASFSGALKPLLDAERAIRKGRQDVAVKLEAEREAQEKALAAARADRAHAEAELARIQSGAAVHDYFAERATSSDYRARMGLLSTIRRDFADLRTWLRADLEHGPPVERIVLYVDDLDRCSSARVVEVLEAVHLLLALDLFVVVVGVDPRWLLGSLEDRYGAQFAARGQRAGRQWRTTPQDFLEKIFQIPFSVRPMDAPGFERLIRDLLPVRRATPEATTPEQANGGSAPEPPKTAAPVEPALASADDLAQQAQDANPIGLQLDEAELDFLGTLSALVPTPRATKRLANTYRLLRAPLEQGELDALVAGEHRAVLVLLAALVGAPGGAAAEVLTALLGEPPETTWDRFLTRVADAPVSTEARRLAAALAAVSDHDLLEAPVERLQRWTPRVARYSFETARLVAEPLPTRTA
jgi:hypothetical protein